MTAIKEEPSSPLVSSQIDLDDGLIRVSGFYQQQDVELDRSLTLWVRRSILDEIKHSCELQQNDPEEENVFYEFSIKINVAELLESSAALGNFLINSTREFLHHLRWIIFKMVKDQKLLDVSTESQILVYPRVTNLAKFSECMGLNRLHLEERLIKMDGTVISLTPVQQYTKGTKYSCLQPDVCPVSNSNNSIFSWLPGTSELELVRPGLQCEHCNTVMDEDVRFRKIGEQRKFKIVLNNGLECLGPYDERRYCRNQPITVIARDDLTEKLKIGHHYWITGMVVRRPLQRLTSHQFYSTVLEDIAKFSAIYLSRNFPFKVFQVEEEKVTSVKKNDDILELVPTSIRSLYEDRLCSPWSFTASLAYCFAESISIGGSYHRLKMVLLLSLVLTGNDILVEDLNGKLVIGNDLQKINMLCSSDDVLPMQRLFSYAAMFCERAVSHQPNLDLFGSTTKHSEFDESLHVDGGALLLAGAQVCLISNVSALKKDELRKLQKSIEDSRVTIDIPRSKSSKDQSDYTQMFFPLKCTIWAITENTPEMKENSKNGLNPLANYFDLVYDFTKEYKLPDEIQDEQIIAVLKQSVGSCSKNEIDQDHLKKFICLARNRHVSFSEDASKMIRSFYLASRRARNSFLGNEIGQQSLQTMFSLAAAHAKLSLRREVSINDALMAILLCEESITMKTGQSVIDIEPKMHFSRKNFAENLGPKNDEMMRMMYKTVSTFCHTYSTGLESLFHPEE